MTDRRQDSYSIRVEAAELARSRTYPKHEANGDEERFAGDKYFMSFTKGLPHNPKTGLIQDPNDFVEYRRSIDDGFIDPFTDRVRHGAKWFVDETDDFKVKPVPTAKIPNNFRQWEAPTAGVVFELQGPDAQAVTMPPAPPLLNKDNKANPELIFEMAEVYELAVLRDKEFNDFEGAISTDADVEAAIARLNHLEYLQNQDEGRPRKVAERRDEYNQPTGKIGFIAQNAFRGSSPGVDIGPYLSQFLLMGNADVDGSGSVDNGFITYGVLNIDQRVPIATATDPDKPETKNFMFDIDSYVSVQRGLGQTQERYEKDGAGKLKRRFISTPRDLATYVHYDALYEAYLNACLILLGMKTPFDPAFDHLSGVGAAAGIGETRRNAGGFALYGGPHILNLVTEVSTRALKAVRFQKFNNHIRLRPEALAARLELVRKFDKAVADHDQATVDMLKPLIPDALLKHVRGYVEALEGNGGGGTSTLGAVADLGGHNYFLPMAFPEGSPMHPAYGAGHATVAGACVTILKAFFDTSAVLVKRKSGIQFARYQSKDEAVYFRAPGLSTGSNKLEEVKPDYFLTLEGELNKLAANISIGRDMAGVHYFSDYYDSLRMGEEIAIGILEEQALTYSTDPFVLSVPTFDGKVERIGRR